MDRMKNWYKNLETRYKTFPEHVQVLNMISDLNKAKSLWDKNRTSARNHLYRALILLDYMKDDPKWRNKLRELLRVRETVGSILVLSQPYGTLDQVCDAALCLSAKAYRLLKVPEET